MRQRMLLAFAYLTLILLPQPTRSQEVEGRPHVETEEARRIKEEQEGRKREERKPVTEIERAEHDIDITKPKNKEFVDADALGKLIDADKNVRGDVDKDKKSPEIRPEDIKNKTVEEIRQLADTLGLERKGNKDTWFDPVTRKERLRIDDGHIDSETGKPYNDANAAVPHVHVFPPEGRIAGSIVDPETGNKHFKIKASD